VDRVEGERGLAGARQAGNHHQAIARQVEVDVLQIVLASAADRDETVRLGSGGTGFWPRWGENRRCRGPSHMAITPQLSQPPRQADGACSACTCRATGRRVPATW